jgi:hypothetical protein
MSFWMTVWKVVFVAAVGVFAVMAVWVTAAGLRDIRKLFATIERSHQEQGE